MTLATQRRDYLASTSLTPPGQIPLVRSFDDARAFGPRTAGRLREITGAIAAAPHEGRLEALNRAAQAAAKEVRADRIDRASAGDRLYNAANAYGLVNDYGDDAVQAIFSEAFVEATVTPNTIDVQEDEIASSNDADLIIHRLSDVAIEPIEQLWQNRFYVGKQSLLIGEQGIGKSQLTCFMAAAVSNGSAWPCNEGQAPLGSVIFLSAEDNAADTIRPRCEAVNANLSRIHVVSSVWLDEKKGRRSFNLQADLTKLEMAIKGIGDVRLVIIDPVSSYMGKVDGHSNTDVRGVLEPIGEMAARLRVCIVSVTHKPKGKGNSAVNVGIGSVAFAAVARSAFLLERDPADRDHILFAQTKNNLARDPGTLAFRIGNVLLNNGSYSTAVHWDPQKVDISADDALSANEFGSAGEDVRRGAAESEDFLQTILAAGALAVRKIKGQAEEAGLSWASVKRAKHSLGIKAGRKGGAAATGWWEWALPNAKGLNSAYEAQDLNVSPLDENEPLRT